MLIKRKNNPPNPLPRFLRDRNPQFIEIPKQLINTSDFANKIVLIINLLSTMLSPFTFNIFSFRRPYFNYNIALTSFGHLI